jgi:membrane protein implicated in regulation of membrane protease activity
MRESFASEESSGELQMFLLLALLFFVFLPSPWDVIGGVSSGALGILEVVYWQRRMRREKVQTGVENLIGATGETTDQLAPSGNVRVLGELWEARSSSELPPGSEVRVVAVHGLILEVESAEEPTSLSSRAVSPRDSRA